MGKKQFIGMFICAIVLGLSEVYAQNSLTIHQTTGNSRTVNLNEIRKITFVNGNMQISDKASDILSYALAEIANVTFEATKTPASGIETEDVLNKLSLYPNPVRNVVYLSGLNEASTVTVYTAAGNIVMHSRVSPGESIHVSELPKGLYLLRVNNDTIKFSKL